MNQQITMYTDGASRGNPGPGGYGVVLMTGSLKKELAQGYRRTTNNRMELMAVIAGLVAMKRSGLNITVYSDSQYVVKAVKEGWLNNWIKTGFKGKKNKDLWMRYQELAANHNIQFVWVKGHAANIYNNCCDELATAAADERDLLIDEGYEQDPANKLL